jgi:PAS domain S-box-containing protein
MEKILFVDDQPQVLQSLRLLFHDYDVITTENGADALLMLKEYPDIAVIVSDQRMPRMQGIELLREVKHLYPKIIRILLTGYADIDAIISSVNQGEVFRFISKPWDSQKLRDTVAMAIRIFHRQQFADTTFLERRKQPREKLGVLIVDDNLNHLSAMRSLLMSDYDVYISDNFDEARNIVNRHGHAIACTICDTYAHGECGVDFLMELKERYPDICAIMHSEQKDADIAIRLVNEVRVFRYLVKPFRKSEFLATVKAAQQQYFLWRQKPVLNDKVFQPTPNTFSESPTVAAKLNTDEFVKILEKGYHAFEQVLDRFPLPAGVLKVGGTFQKVNTALCNLLGYSSEELVNLCLPDIVQHQDISARLTEILNELARTQSPISWEMIYTTKHKQVKMAKVCSALTQKGDEILLYGFLTEID